MGNATIVSLQNNWVYYFTANLAKDLSTSRKVGKGWIPLGELRDWVMGTSVKRGADWFCRSVTVGEINSEVEHFLSIDRVPAMTTVFVNGCPVVELDVNSSKRFSITSHLRPGCNEIALRVICTSQSNGGFFDGMALESVAQVGVATSG